jgi:MFS family permease
LLELGEGLRRLGAQLAGDPRGGGTGEGLGFGMVTQVLVTAVQNSVDRRELGVATATTGFFRALGGAIGAAALGAVFAAQAGTGAARSDVIDGVQAVFLVAASISALALVAVLFLREAGHDHRTQPSKGEANVKQRAQGAAA